MLLLAPAIQACVVFVFTNNYTVFLYFCILAPNVKLTILIPQSKCLISAGRGSKLSQVLFGNIFYVSFPFFITISVLSLTGILSMCVELALSVLLVIRILKCFVRPTLTYTAQDDESVLHIFSDSQYLIDYIR